ncbi:bifunctional 4-hydroxy-2-oxoglutarate aldolase/2-dehydro-3-deoxy-phosphogluconate aldolase [Oscillospiraceae bacterium HV4-5-C5C]|nr:bifunctional 4-hydroxy-2-oxoglutarate aldolase/2-dehydro-3-deoxy-phosphogluconate aldolase [Oscillospiraceae bacterium HV4-5-C5C]
MDKLLQQIEKIGVLPVIKLNHPERDAAKLAQALTAGQLPAAEITFRAAGAADAIRLTLEAAPDMLVGAGTVLTVEQAKAAIAAGARFIVSPGFNPEVVSYVLSQKVLMLPGTVTPTEIEMALGYGLKVLKFFPASVYGGVKAIKALSAPYGGVRFIPTGGVSLENLAEYLAVPQILACGGSYMVKESLLEAGDFAQITELCHQTEEIVRRYRA